jgi:hypothetical protein
MMSSIKKLLGEVSSSEKPTELKKDGEGNDIVKSGRTDNDKSRGTVPKVDGKAEVTAGRKYWKDVKGKVVRVGSVYYTLDDGIRNVVYWEDGESSAALEKLAKLAKPRGLPEAKGKTSKKRPTQPTFSRKFFGAKYKPNKTVTSESLPNPVEEDTDDVRYFWEEERRKMYKNKLATMGAKELESYLKLNAHRWPLGDWHVKTMRVFAQHHGLDWPEPPATPATESFEPEPEMNMYRFTNPNANACVVTARSVEHAWKKLQLTHAYYFCRSGWKRVNMSQPASADEDGADVESAGGASAVNSDEGMEEGLELLPDPGIQVKYEEIDSLVVDEKVHRLQNDTKCTFTPRRKTRRPICGL